MTDVIYLAPPCQEHERMWCEHDAPVDCECVDGPHPWIKYVAAMRQPTQSDDYTRGFIAGLDDGAKMDAEEYAFRASQPTQSDALLDAEGVKLYWYRQGKDDGVEHERAKIVAWLRDGFVRDWGQLWRNQLINAIEAGEHLK